MEIRITPKKLSGSVTPPPSKSMAHRLLIAAALSEDGGLVRNIALSKDIEATLRCIEALGGGWERVGEDGIRVRGVSRSHRSDGLPRFDCGESGSTLRFFIPIALALAGGGVFTGQGRLMERPQTPYQTLFAEKGIAFSQADGVLTLSGRLTPGGYRLPGNVSSQFFTGLFYALPLLAGDSTVTSTTPLESEDYVRMTVDAIAAAGLRITRRPDGSFALPHGAYRLPPQTVEADWSQAGFWYAANFLGASLRVEGLNPASGQGDRVVASLAEALRMPGDREIDSSGCPDLLPPLAVMAAVRTGVTRFTNAARLRLKESDRLQTVCALLTALGGQAKEGPDSLTVYGLPRLRGGVVDGANDHRIVMAAAVAALACEAPVTIVGAEAVSKSYPDFFGEYTRLGGNADVL